MTHRRAFTLIELLVVTAVITTLIGLMAPALSRARDAARRVVCLSNQRQLVTAWTMYADANNARALPHLAPGQTDRVYWYGAEDRSTGALDHARGTLSPYLEGGLGDRSAFECPAQPAGTYREQGAFGGFTTTYGYNAYALAPPSSGYSDLINRRWPAVHDFAHPSSLYVFADTLLSLYADAPSNSALLDPPQTYDRRRRSWRENRSPTTAFRHGVRGPGFGQAIVARADASVSVEQVDRDAFHIEAFAIGSTAPENDPSYVPDWRRW